MQIRFKRIATSKKSAVAQKQGRGGCRLVKMTVRESMTREESVSGLLKKKFYLLPSHHFRFLFLVYPRILSWFSFRHFAIYFINFFRFFRQYSFWQAFNSSRFSRRFAWIFFLFFFQYCFWYSRSYIVNRHPHQWRFQTASLAVDKGCAWEWTIASPAIDRNQHNNSHPHTPTLFIGLLLSLACGYSTVGLQYRIIGKNFQASGK